jgi:hypothetical protein
MAGSPAGPTCFKVKPNGKINGIRASVTGVSSTFRQQRIGRCMEVLTAAQKKLLREWVGTPYNSPSWQEPMEALRRLQDVTN